MNTLDLGVPLRSLCEMQCEADHCSARGKQERCRDNPPIEATENTEQIQSKGPAQFYGVGFGDRKEWRQPPS